MTSQRNSFLTKSCTNFQQQHIFRNSLDKNFYSHLGEPSDFEQRCSLTNFKKYQESKRPRGYDEIGMDIMIRNLSCDDFNVVEISLEHLESELKKFMNISHVLKNDIVEKVSIIIDQNASTRPKIVQNSLKILKLLANDFKVSLNIVEKSMLMGHIFELMKTQKDLEEKCAEVLFSLSEFPIAANKISSKYFHQLQNNIKITQNEKFISALTNLVSFNPKKFIKLEIAEALLGNLQYSSALKCLAIILNSDHAGILVNNLSSEIESSITFILQEPFSVYEDSMKESALMLLRSYLLNKKTFEDNLFLQHLLDVMIECCMTKTNKFLQQISIQNLRIVCDVPRVKEQVYKFHNNKLKEISCLSKEAIELKSDLLQWLEYRNYTMNDGSNKYSKIFI